jgi:hypothetical protein
MSDIRDYADEEELVLYLDNDEGLHKRKVFIFNALARKMDRGSYDKKLAPKAFVAFLNMVAQRYVREFGTRSDKWNLVFTPIHRRRAALDLVEQFENWYKFDRPHLVKK